MVDFHWLRAQKRIEKAIDTIADEGQTQEDTDLTRLLYLRPSSFSYCPLNTFLSLNRSLRKTRSMDFAGAFFTKVGTATHEVWQETTFSLFGDAGNPHNVIVLRDWVCSNKECKHRVELSAKAPSKCPKCGTAKMRSTEHRVQRPGIRGHVDEIFVLTDLKVAIIFDWKSCSAAKLATKKLGADVAYEAQISTYASLLRKRLASMGYEVAGWCLGYFTRDNPFKRKLVFGTKLIETQTLRLWRDQHTFVLHLTNQSDVLKLVDARPCKTREFAEKHHSYCSYKNSCTHSDDAAREYAVDIWRTLRKDSKLPAIEYIRSQQDSKATSTKGEAT